MVNHNLMLQILTIGQNMNSQMLNHNSFTIDTHLSFWIPACRYKTFGTKIFPFTT